jgi:hypothetical protein
MSGRPGLPLLFGGVMALMPSLAVAQSAETQALRREVDELRRLLREQQETIGGLERQVDALRTQANEDRRVLQSTEQTAVEARQAAIDRPLIASAEPRIKVALSGQVNRMLNVAEDGKSTKAYFVDNDLGVSRLRVVGTGEVSDKLTLGTNLELAISPNNSAEVSQTDEDGSQEDEFRKVEAIFAHEDLGTISFGRGDPATKDIARLDLSGTDVIAFTNLGDLAGGLFFRTEDEEDDSGITVADVFGDFDQNRTSRIRYDTPSLGGVTAAGSFGSDQKWGTALRWAGEGQGLEATAGAGLQDPSQEGVDLVYAGSASALHQASGLNLTMGAAVQDQDDGTGRAYYVKAGWLAELIEIGPTAFSIDLGSFEDAPAEGDEGLSLGLAAVQQLSDYGTDLYASLRSFDLDAGEGPSTSTIYVGTAGTRIKF